MKQKESLILFDSPFKGLDPLSIQQMIQVFEVLLEKGHTLIIAESEEFSPLADHIIYP